MRRLLWLWRFCFCGILGFAYRRRQYAVEAYSIHGQPPVSRRAIAGLWRLTPNAAPMKEFTVYPKKQAKQPGDLLLVLSEDGSFQQYKDDAVSDTGDVKEDIDNSWKTFTKKQQQERKRKANEPLKGLVKGIWDYRDGELILAADRPETKKYPSPPKKKVPQQQQNHPDTLLVGRVVASYESSLLDNPVLSSQDKGKAETNVSKATKMIVTRPSESRTKAVDTHLSVPTGSVNVGRFFYPKRHPSFFDQPMFQPVRLGGFRLRQVLGSLNARTNSQENQLVEKFQRDVFYNKTFLLTSHPLRSQRPKGKRRWSIKYNKFVEDPPSKEAAAAHEEEKSRPVQIRVLKVQFFPNNTFSTIAGLGSSAILRGKFDVIGRDQDQLWMQIMRFGFGRSVSGSVYSEGRMLSHEDAKTYWGTIRFEEQEQKDSEEDKTPKANPSANTACDDVNDTPPPRIEVKGSVLLGVGIEPTPVGRFIMRETSSTELVEVDDTDEDEEDEDGDDDEGLGSTGTIDGHKELGNDGIDWTNESGFQ